MTKKSFDWKGFLKTDKKKMSFTFILTVFIITIINIINLIFDFSFGGVTFVIVDMLLIFIFSYILTAFLWNIKELNLKTMVKLSSILSLIFTVIYAYLAVNFNFLFSIDRTSTIIHTAIMSSIFISNLYLLNKIRMQESKQKGAGK